MNDDDENYMPSTAMGRIKLHLNATKSKHGRLRCEQASAIEVNILMTGTVNNYISQKRRNQIMCAQVLVEPR